MKTKQLHWQHFAVLRLKARFPTARGSSGHRPFISLFTISFFVFLITLSHSLSLFAFLITLRIPLITTVLTHITLLLYSSIHSKYYIMRTSIHLIAFSDLLTWWTTTSRLSDILLLNHFCKSTVCSIFAGLIFALFVPEFSPIILHLPLHGSHIFISSFCVHKLLL